MDINKLSLRKIRAIHYRGQTTKLKTMGTDINNFFVNPYSYFKSRYYIEVSAILVFFLQLLNSVKFKDYCRYYFSHYILIIYLIKINLNYL